MTYEELRPGDMYLIGDKWRALVVSIIRHLSGTCTVVMLQGPSQIIYVRDRPIRNDISEPEVRA